jgi:hypothetical protein
VVYAHTKPGDQHGNPRSRGMRITRSAVFQYRWFLRTAAGAAALMILLWVGAMGPHLVHHLFDEHHKQVCLMFEQANIFPSLMVAQPSLVLPQMPQRRRPARPVSSPLVQLTPTGSPRAPPSVPA